MNAVKVRGESMKVVNKVCPYHEDVVYTDRHHVCGWYEARDKASVSNLARNKLAYEGAILVPMVLPCICK